MGGEGSKPTVERAHVGIWLLNYYEPMYEPMSKDDFENRRYSSAAAKLDPDVRKAWTSADPKQAAAWEAFQKFKKEWGAPAQSNPPER
jgi:hypothetical protein